MSGDTTSAQPCSAGDCSGSLGILGACERCGAVPFLGNVRPARRSSQVDPIEPNDDTHDDPEAADLAASHYFGER